MKEDMKQYLDSLTKLPKVTKDIIDLHNHTTTSDGTLSPQQLIDFALQRGLKIIAITDHDTIDCLDWSLEYSKNKPIEIVPGIEFSCEEIARGFDEVHILGLFIDPKNERLIERTKIIRKKRVERAREIIKKLQLLDYSINFEEVEQGVGASLGRPHIAKVLVEKYPEKFTNVSDIFSTLLGTGKPAFVPRGDKIKIEE